VKVALADNMDLTGYSIPDIYGVERVELQGEFTKASLAERLIEEWIPYFECHKCGRWDYCKFAQPHPANPERSVDIKCGVASAAIRNMVTSAFPSIEELNREQIENFLDGTFYFFRFIYDAEQYIGMNMDNSFHSYWEDFAPYIYSNIGFLRNHLNRLASHWKGLPGFKAESSLLLVEGQSEKAFFDELRKSHSSWFLDLNVEVYGGKGNRKSKRIHMLLDKYKDQGLVVYAQGDADGNSADVFRGLINASAIEEVNTFVFQFDFESSLPTQLAYDALTDLGLLSEVVETQFLEEMADPSKSFSTKLQEQLGVDISSYKIDFAVAVAEILNEVSWHMDDDFMQQTELGKFLRFVQGIR
jgi:hypothetical protein